VTLLPVNKSDGVVKPVCNSHMQPGAQYVFDKNPDRVEHWTHRQRWPHTHCFVTEPYNKRFHFVPDLGVDKVSSWRERRCANARPIVPPSHSRSHSRWRQR